MKYKFNKWAVSWIENEVKCWTWRVSAGGVRISWRSGTRGEQQRPVQKPAKFHPYQWPGWQDRDLFQQVCRWCKTSRSDWCTRWLCCFLKYLDRLEKWLAELIPNGLHCYQNRTFSSIDRFSCIIEKLSSVKLSLWRLRRKFWLFKMCLQEMEWCLRILLPSALYVLQFHLPSLGICSCVIAFLFFFRRADGIFFSLCA